MCLRCHDYIRKRYVAMLERLDEVLARDPERGREELRGVLGEKIKLEPDPSGKFLWADYSLGLAPLLGAHADLMVAGAGFEPAPDTYLPILRLGNGMR